MSVNILGVCKGELPPVHHAHALLKQTTLTPSTLHSQHLPVSIAAHPAVAEDANGTHNSSAKRLLHSPAAVLLAMRHAGGQQKIYG